MLFTTKLVYSNFCFFRHLNNYLSHQAKELQIEEVLSQLCVKSETKQYHIGKLVIVRWKDKVLIPCGPYLSKLLLEQFDNYRSGRMIEMSDLIKQCVTCYVTAEGYDVAENNSFSDQRDDFKVCYFFKICCSNYNKLLVV